MRRLPSLVLAAALLAIATPLSGALPGAGPVGETRIATFTMQWNRDSYTQTADSACTLQARLLVTDVGEGRAAVSLVQENARSLCLKTITPASVGTDGCALWLDDESPVYFSGSWSEGWSYRVEAGGSFAQYAIAPPVEESGAWTFSGDCLVVTQYRDTLAGAFGWAL